MSFANEGNNGMYMPVAPLGNYYGGGMGGFGNGDGWWILLLLLCGWGNGFGGFGGWGGMGNMMGFGIDFPWLLNGQQGINNNVSDGFRDQMLQSSINSVGDKISSGFGDVQLGIAGINQNLCQTGNNVVNAVTGAQNALAQQLYSNELASLNRSFAEQQANQAGFTAVNAGLADAKYVEATEACATRTANAQNTRDIIDAQTRGTQAILDKLCQLELDGVKGQLAQAQRENVSLQNAVNMATMRESQTAQTAQILAGQAAEIDGVYNRLKNCPVPSMPVYGNTPIFTCPQNAYSGCGCGCSGVA